MNIVLVHGIFDTFSLFDYMKEKLESEGHTCYIPSLKPASAYAGIDDLSHKLKAFIEKELGTRKKFVLVGFSMGVIVSRCYLQKLEGYKRCQAFHAISGPMQGSYWAKFGWWRGAKDMRANSPLLQELDETEHILDSMPLYSYRTPYDVVILPSDSSFWPMAENYVTGTLLHRSMVKDKKVINVIRQSCKQKNIQSA